MNEGLQIYKFNGLTVYKQYFYNMTRLNFMYDRRRLFSFNKNGMEYNSYFPFNMVKEKVKFHGLYLSAYSAIDSFSHMDFDFDIGFNNIEYEIEEKIVNLLRDESDEMEIILKIFNSRENKNIIDEINNKYNTLFSLDGLYNTYIIKAKEIKSINLVQEYISCILINRKDFQLPFEQCSFNLVDFKCIKQLIERYELILFRAPIYANYNIIIYSGNKDLIYKLNNKILKLKNYEFFIESINDIEDSRNFLLV
ncbi:MAG: hypothetical protein HFH68_13415 [Lachnospiraceae bacterium]|nr:hypothetical protein [Lachnospiraceae bacterium]